ncbi:MAG TPA: hypothetical protein P5524_01605 [Candidatus Paceibacterota bacterium]|nr:hypothetical protein [Candidatus Paceibacterota bacterium]
MDINKILQSKTFAGIMIAIIALAILLLGFKLGTVVGARKADFSCRWSDNYHQNFGGPQKGFMQGLGDRDFIEANGTFGQVIKIDGSTLVVKGRNDVEKIVLVSDTTVIKSFQDTIKAADLKVDSLVVIIGEPNAAGQIEAKLIRVMPPLPTQEPPLTPPIPR